MMGPEPEEMGFIKNMFWGRIREDLVFPYPEPSAAEKAKCENLLDDLDDYLENEHPRIEIDQDQVLPQWAIDRLFEIGVLGMTIPEEYGGLGLGVASYNRVLERIGRTCGSTAVVVSAHQSIGCKALMLFRDGRAEKAVPPESRPRVPLGVLPQRAPGRLRRRRAGDDLPPHRRRRALHPQRREEVVDVGRARRPLHGHGEAVRHRSEDGQGENDRHGAHRHAGHGRRRHLPEEPLEDGHPGGRGRPASALRMSRCPRSNFCTKKGRA